LVWVIRSTGEDQSIGADLLDGLGADLGLGVGEREDQGLFRHRFDHLRLDNAARGKAEEHVCVGHDVAERAGAGVASVPLLVRVHPLLSPGVDHALGVGNDDVFELEAEADEQVEAGEHGRTGP
jgi:hypothetical protein